MSRVFSSANTGANENYVHTPASAVYNNLGAFTYSAWVYPTASPDGDFSTIIVKDPTGAFSPFIEFEGNGTTTLTAAVTNAGGVTFAVSTSNDLLALNTWANVIATFDINGDRKIHLYVNGVEINYAVQDPLPAGAQSDNSADGFYFGNDTFDDGWDGNLAELAVWNTVLTGPQITAVAASTTGVASIQPANLVGYWHLCGTASPEPDVSGNGNDGVLSTNAPTQGANSPGFGCGSMPLPYSVPDSRNKVILTPLGFDTFQLPDGSPLNPANWTINTSFPDDFLSVKNEVCVSTAVDGVGLDFWTGTPTPNDQFCSAVVSTLGISSDITVYVRASLDLSTYYSASIFGNGDNTYTFDIESSSGGGLVTTSVSSVNRGDTITISVVGSKITATFNNITLTVTDTNFASGLTGLEIFTGSPLDSSVSSFLTGLAQTSTFPNQSRNVNETLIYDVQTSSNSAVPGVDSRTAGAPVDCRVSPNIPINSRTPGLYGPNEP